MAHCMNNFSDDFDYFNEIGTDFPDAEELSEGSINANFEGDEFLGLGKRGRRRRELRKQGLSRREAREQVRREMPRKAIKDTKVGQLVSSALENQGKGAGEGGGTRGQLGGDAPNVTGGGAKLSTTTMLLIGGGVILAGVSAYFLLKK